MNHPLNPSMAPTGAELINLLILERDAGDLRSAIVVEGPEDCMLLDVHLAPAEAKTTAAGGKTSTLDAAEIARDEGLDWAIFVVDGDFDGAEITALNVLVTSNYDLLMDVLGSHPFLLHGVAVTATGQRFLLTDDQVVEHIARVAGAVQAARRIVIDDQLGISTRSFNFRGSAALGSFTEITAWVHQQLTDRSKTPIEDSVTRRISAAIREVPVSSIDHCNSHDVIGALADVVRHHGRQCGHETIAIALRSSVSCERFASLPLVQALTEWQARRSPGLRIFRCQALAA